MHVGSSICGANAYPVEWVLCSNPREATSAERTVVIDNSNNVADGMGVSE
jgi:hypothetical protein